jgi:hypothetical protein
LLPIEPRGRVAHRAGNQPTAMDAPFLPARDQARLLEDAEVLRHRRQRHGERSGEVHHRRLDVGGEAFQDRPPRRARQRGEHGVEGGRFVVNHAV